MKEIGFEIIEMERKIFNTDIKKEELAKNRLKEIIKTCEEKIKNEKEPIRILTNIHETLKELGYKGDNKDRTFTEALIEREMSCRHRAYVYLTIGERYNLPICAVPLPQHIIIRWIDEKGTISWETITGNKINEDSYILSYKISRNAIKKGVYLRNLNNDEVKATAICTAGILLLRFRKYEEAMKCFDRAISLDENHVNAWHNKGVGFSVIGKYKEAIECFDKAISLDENHVDAWYNKGLTLLAMRKYKEAIECFDKATSLDENRVDAWNNKGVAFFVIGKYKEAIECFDKATSLDEKYVGAWYNKGVAFFEIGEYKEAMKCFDKVISLSLDENYSALARYFRSRCISMLWKNK